MILQALTRYYSILSEDSSIDISPPGYSVVNVSFALNLSEQGELMDIFPQFVTEQRGKKMVELPRRMILPAQVKRSSGINPNTLWDNGTYVLGIDEGNKKDPAYRKKRFFAFREHNIALLERIECPEARAVCAFLKNWNPETALEHPLVVRNLEGLLAGANLVFKLDGKQGYVHEVPAIKLAWENTLSPDDRKKLGQCLVTGNIGPVARLHPSLKGVKGTNPTGGTLVGFNAPAYESYNRTDQQGWNSPVSEQATFAYTTALNYLLSSSNRNRKFTLGDATVVYWAESEKTTYASVFQGLIDPENQTEEAKGSVSPVRDESAERLLKEIAQKIKAGDALDVTTLKQEIDPDTQFYVLALSPNAARISVRFFYASPFLKTIQNLMKHHQDMSIGQERPYSLWSILNETVSKKASDKTPSPLLGGAVMRSILTNAPYPAALYYAIINRVRADMDDPDKRIYKITPLRVAIIKAYLIRKFRYLNKPEYKEVLSMALNEQSTNQAYLLGRLFAVLEKAQQDAAGPVKLNSTIKDRYFTSACATPATTFPVLLRLSQHHISKSDYGYAIDRKIGEIMELLEITNQPFPQHLLLDEQGLFILGFYHQRTDLYKSKKEAITEGQGENAASVPED
ncbi:MAG: type I-C CRISPR-associated protein Cas8c/Csd1 [Anaerolineaceae bacterium]